MYLDFNEKMIDSFDLMFRVFKVNQNDDRLVANHHFLMVSVFIVKSQGENIDFVDSEIKQAKKKFAERGNFKEVSCSLN